MNVAGMDWAAGPKGSIATAKLGGCRLKGSDLERAVASSIGQAGEAASPGFGGGAGGGSGGSGGPYKCGGGNSSWVLPFFGTDFNTFSNEFADTFSQITPRGTQQVGSTLAGTAMDIAAQINAGKGQIGRQAGRGISMLQSVDWGQKLLKMVGYKGSQSHTPGSPGTWIETPKFFQAGMNSAPLNISFILSNTLGGHGQNLSFVKSFAAANKPIRGKAYSIEYPSVYRISMSHGHRNMEWAYCSSFQVGMLGARPGGIPQAYQCDFSFTSLVMETAGAV